MLLAGVTYSNFKAVQRFIFVSLLFIFCHTSEMQRQKGGERLELRTREREEVGRKWGRRQD